jgi:hypothetical protein
MSALSSLLREIRSIRGPENDEDEEDLIEDEDDVEEKGIALALRRPPSQSERDLDPPSVLEASGLRLPFANRARH